MVTPKLIPIQLYPCVHNYNFIKTVTHPSIQVNANLMHEYLYFQSLLEKSPESPVPMSSFELWGARNNIDIFLRWCRSVGVKKECMFEVDGLGKKDQYPKNRKYKFSAFWCVLSTFWALRWSSTDLTDIFSESKLRTPLRGLISFTYVVRFSLVDRYRLLVA